MHYLYHYVREDIQGTVLYPLNVLKEKYPEVYAKHAKKYAGREELMQFVIPHLYCFWNDVIHFSAIEPAEVKRALVAAGMPEKYTLSYYQVDPKLLEPKNTIVYLYQKDRGVLDGEESDYASYDPTDIKKYSHLPEMTKEYYKEMYDSSQLPNMNHGVPHILYKGSLEVKDLPSITV